jgi:heme-degrading monooxygenase HmoA
VIARIWRGATRAEDADGYVAYMRTTGVREYLETEGNRGAVVLRRARDGKSEFVFLSLWESMDAVRRFAGDDPARAVFYDEDDDFLVERDLHVDHFEVVVDEVTNTAE